MKVPSLPRKTVSFTTKRCLIEYMALAECLFVEGSARTGANIVEAFTKLTQTVIYKIDSGEINEASLSTQKRL